MKTTMTPPSTNTEEVLYTLIKQGHVSIFDFPYLSGFRTRLSELKNKYGLNLNTVKHQRCNKFGRVFTYALHKLVNKDQAKSIYKKITEQNKTKTI